MNLSRALAGFLTSSRPQKWALLRPAAALRSSPYSTEYDAPAKRAYKKRPKPSEPELELEPEPEPLGSLSEPPPPAPPKEKSTLFPAMLNPPPMKDRSKLPRPSEIPFQARVANSVHLVGTIGIAIQLETSPDGVLTAISVLIQDRMKDFPQFWIPVIFQGDLAEIAACHLRENDLVCVTGQLSGDRPPFTIKDAQANIQIMAHGLCFVEKYCPRKEGHMENEQDKAGYDHSGIHIEKSGADVVHIPHEHDIIRASSEEKLATMHLWDDLLLNPHNWWDNRTSKGNPTSAAFRHKDNGQFLGINDSTPKWVLPKLDKLVFAQRTPKSSQKIGNVKGPENHTERLWNDLVANPEQWWDKRMDKLNKSVNPKYPDFKHKITEKALWLNSAPDWVLPKLNRVESNSNGILKQRDDATSIQENEKGEYCVSKKSYEVKEGKNAAVSKRNNDENLWKELLENPNKWWDNRSNKFNPKSPDFKHKDTGEALWLSSCPSWVLPKLPPSTVKRTTDDREKATLLS